MPKRIPRLTFTLFALLTSILAFGLIAQEAAALPATDQILSYVSDITVNPDGTLLVGETIESLPTARRPSI